jgi:hypothetical protein
MSHFMKRDESGLGYVDYSAFYNKYIQDNPTPFHVGYYFHLIADEIWLQDIYYKKIKFLPDEEKLEAKKMYYRDFGRLNGKLIDHYSLKLEPLDVQPVEIEEIDYTLLPGIISDVETDFRIADSSKHEALEILDWEKVIETIEKTVITCVANWKGAK